MAPDEGQRQTWLESSPGGDPAYYQAVGRAIKVLRTERGLERKDLAEVSGVSYAYLSEIENGKKRPSSKSLVAIAMALGLRPYEVLETAEAFVSPVEGTDEGLTTGSPASAGSPQVPTGFPPPPWLIEQSLDEALRQAGPAAEADQWVQEARRRRAEKEARILAEERESRAGDDIPLTPQPRPAPQALAATPGRSRITGLARRLRPGARSPRVPAESALAPGSSSTREQAGSLPDPTREALREEFVRLAADMSDEDLERLVDLMKRLRQ